MPGPGSQACPKPVRGSHAEARDAMRTRLASIDKREKAAAKKRDGGCRWPEKHKCKGVIEAAHVVDASLGGEMHRSNLIALCAWLHRSGPVSVHGKHLRVEPETPRGTDGACSFWQVGVDGKFYLVARETAIKQYERD